MTYAKVIADSISPNGERIITVSTGFERFILPEVNTYGSIRRSTESSRAVGLKAMRRKIKGNPARPVSWNTDRPGMVGGEPLEGWRLALALTTWDTHRRVSLALHRVMQAAGVHKQVANRLVETHMYVGMTWTGHIDAWHNLFAQRYHRDAQPEFKRLASALIGVVLASEPREVDYGDWHTPHYGPETGDIDSRIKASSGACARQSYGSGPKGLALDGELHDRLRASDPPHLAPFEHVATPIVQVGTGPYKGWNTFRQVEYPKFLTWARPESPFEGVIS